MTPTVVDIFGLQRTPTSHSSEERLRYCEADDQLVLVKATAGWDRGYRMDQVVPIK